MASKIREAIYPAEFHEVFLALDSVVRSLGMEVVHGNPQGGSLRFKAGMSALSWGEDLDALIQPAGPGAVRVQIRSGLRFGLVDWGRNNKNLDRIFAALDERLAGAPDAGTVAPPPPPPDPVSPTAPPPPPAPVAPPPYAAVPSTAGWQPDPAGRHAERLWDGDRWTAHVRDGDVVGVDPYEGPGIG